MSEKLILRLSSQQQQQIPWLVCSDSEEEVLSSGTLSSIEQLSELQSYALGRKVTVLVAGADVSLIRHTLPNKPNRQILQALPFMLEEELAQDIEQLHFTVADSGQDEESGQYWLQVAVVKKQLMALWIEKLAELNIMPNQFIPETLCLPTETDMSILEFNQGWLYRLGQWQGSFVPAQWMPMVVAGQPQEALSSVTAFSPLPDELLNQDVEVDYQISDMPLLMLARQAANSKFNLLHSEFQAKKPVSKNWLVWRPAVILAVIVGLLSLLQSVIVIQQADAETEKLKQQLVKDYKAAFPKETPRINIIRRQLQRKLAEAQGTSGQGEESFIAALTTLAPALQKHKSVEMTSVRFEAKRQELRLSIQTSGFQQFEQFKEAIEQLGLEVKQGTLNNEDGKVVGVLVVKRKA